MYEILLATKENTPRPPNGLIFITESSTDIAYNMALLSGGWSHQYSVDDGPMITSSTLNIPAGRHRTRLILRNQGPAVNNFTLGLDDKLLEVEDWYDLDCGNLRFTNCPRLTKVPTYLFPKALLLSNMFAGCSAFNSDISEWDTSKITNIGSMLQNCVAFNRPLNNWDVSKVTHMVNAFYGCVAFNQPLNNWDTGLATNMTTMFFGCSSYNQDISNWNVSKVTSSVAFADRANAWLAQYKPRFN